MVLLSVSTADVSSVIGGRVIRDDQFKILETLAQQSLDSFGEILMAVVYRKSDT